MVEESIGTSQLQCPKLKESLLELDGQIMKQCAEEGDEGAVPNRNDPHTPRWEISCRIANSQQKQYFGETGEQTYPSVLSIRHIQEKLSNSQKDSNRICITQKGKSETETDWPREGSDVAEARGQGNRPKAKQGKWRRNEHKNTIQKKLDVVPNQGKNNQDGDGNQELMQIDTKSFMGGLKRSAEEPCETTMLLPEMSEVTKRTKWEFRSNQNLILPQAEAEQLAQSRRS